MQGTTRVLTKEHAEKESVAGVPKIKEGYNPATWILDITIPAVEGQLNV